MENVKNEKCYSSVDCNCVDFEILLYRKEIKYEELIIEISQLKAILTTLIGIISLVVVIGIALFFYILK